MVSCTIVESIKDLRYTILFFFFQIYISTLKWYLEISQLSNVIFKLGIFRWWKDAQDSMPSESVEKREILYTASCGSSYGGPMKLINNIFNSDILFDLRREGDALQNGETGEASVSGRDFALVSSDMWLQALKW